MEKLAGDIWRLNIPAGSHGTYRWAQLDDYTGKKREDFLWKPPLKMSLKARLSDRDIPGTWGFGFWNDPFSFGLGLKGMSRRFPALPDAAWFFHASAPNYLAFSDHHPATGLLAAVFSSRAIPALLMVGGLLLSPLLLFPPAARLLRRLIHTFVEEDAGLVELDPREWHEYAVIWQEGRVEYMVDGRKVHETIISPRRRLGLVVWIDNQYASFLPQGKLRSGTLVNPENAWMEIEKFDIMRYIP